MKCPNCVELMELSDVVIDTLPETEEFFCVCGVVVDVCDGLAHVCFRSKEKFSEVRISELNEILKAER